MLRWIRGSASDHPLEHKEDARQLLSELAEKGPFRALEELSGLLDAVKTADKLKPMRAFEIVELLDRSARPYQRKLNLDYVTGGARLTKFQQHRITATNYAFQTQLTEGYRFCLAKFEVGAVGSAALKPSLPKIAGRALRACGAQLKWSLLRYGPVDRQIWENLARLYTASEALGFGPWLLNLYRGEKRETTAEREFLRPLMLAISSPDGLLPIQIELADRVIAHCCDAFVISSQPARELHYVSDLAAAFPPGRISPRITVTPQTRFFGPGEAAKRIARYIAEIEHSGLVPQELNLGTRGRPDGRACHAAAPGALLVPQPAGAQGDAPAPHRARHRGARVRRGRRQCRRAVLRVALRQQRRGMDRRERECRRLRRLRAQAPGRVAAGGQPDRGAPRGRRGLGGRHRAAGDGRRAGQPLRRHPDARHRRCRGHRVPERRPASPAPRCHPRASCASCCPPPAQPRAASASCSCARSCSRPSKACEMHAYDREYLLTPVALAEQGDDFEIGRFRILEREG